MSREMPTTKLDELYEMLAHCRPHESSTEAEFVRRYVQSIPGMGFDGFGNGLLRIGTAPVLWSCHTDTVHHKEGMQEVEVFKHKGRPEFMMLNRKHQTRGKCLGADDGAGVWLMRRMIEQRIPGLYVFHAGEEHGGLGSKWLAANRPELLANIKYAIAFDRKGTSDVITHQMGERTCSDRFARTLANQLGGSFVPDATGVFTDTLHYADRIPECTNISVGYDGAHSPQESLDLVHLLEVQNAILSFDLSAWTAYRQPGEKDLFDLHTPISERKALTEYDEDALDELCMIHPDVAARLIRLLGGGSIDMVELLDHEGYDLN